MTHTSQAVKTSESVCSKTLFDRNKHLKHQLQKTSGNATQATAMQTGKLLKSFDRETRKDILKQGGVPRVEINADTMVGMKVDIGLSWEGLKVVSRYIYP